MGSCLGRLLNEADEDGQTGQSASQQSQARHSRRHRRSHQGLSQPHSNASNSSQDDDDVPLLNGAGPDDPISGSTSRRHRRRHHHRSSRSGHGQQGSLQYFNGASSSMGDPATPETNADIKMAQRVGLIQQLPLIHYDEERKQIAQECVICMLDFSTGDMLRCLPCMHSFHDNCIDQWLMKSLTCPSCLEPVDAALLATFATGWSN